MSETEVRSAVIAAMTFGKKILQARPMDDDKILFSECSIHISINNVDYF